MSSVSSYSLTSVEKAFMAINKDSNQPNVIEKIGIVEVQNVYELGKIVALAFIQWIKENSEGVIALPTGRSPEYFIKTLEFYRENWTSKVVKEDMKLHGLECYSDKNFPPTNKLKFVMLDEFFPMLPSHRNSFVNYIRKFYTGPLGIEDDNILDFDLLRNRVISIEEMKLFLDSETAVDLSLLSRSATSDEELKKKTILEKIQNYCDTYERKVRDLGGIGFFLGGIGPDGHIAFNQEGCKHNCKTRLVNFNYPTAAAASSDLGGIEIAKKKAAMTIGLDTIAFNKNVKAIIMAAGEGKATVIKGAIEEDSDESRPATSLHSLPNAIFYITHGAANKLVRKLQKNMNDVNSDVVQWALQYLSGNLSSSDDWMIQPPNAYSILEDFIYDTSLNCDIPVHLLKLSNISSLEVYKYIPQWLKDSSEAFDILCCCASRRLKEKINGGLIESCPIGTKLLHTAPHHDDIMLSYHGAMHYMLGRQHVSTYGSQMQNVGASPNLKRRISYTLGELYNENLNHFAYLTSGFHSVNDEFLRNKVKNVLGPWHDSNRDSLKPFIDQAVLTGELTREYDDIMYDFKLAFTAKDFHKQDFIENIIFLRKVAEVWAIPLKTTYARIISELRKCVETIQIEYLQNHSPGDAVPKEIQLLKGCMRESEVDRVWALSNMPMDRIYHLRSKFYNDDFFTPLPSLEDDAMPMANLMKAQQPDMISVAFDPEGTGPDTHYKVLQVVAAGLRVAIDRGDLEKHPKVWGYRNVWFTFRPTDATLMIPCTNDDLDLMHDTFISCFTTQKSASFPSPHYDGPFSAWARQIQKEQRKMLSTLLGEDYFISHKNPRVRESGGFIFIQAMYAERFLREVEELKSKFESI